MNKQQRIVFFVSVALFFIFVLLDNHYDNYDYTIIFALLLCFTGAFLVLKSTKSIKTTLMIPLGILFLTFLSIFIMFTIRGSFETFVPIGLLSVLVFIIASVVPVFLHYTRKIWVKTVIIGLFLTMSYYSVYIPVFTQQQVAFKNLDGKTEQDINLDKVSFIQRNKDSLVENILLTSEKDIYVLDFWNNGCGICLQKLPKVKKLADKYKNSHNIGFYSVNTFRQRNKEEDINTAEKLLEKYGVGLDNLYLSQDALSPFPVEKYPTVLVVKKDKVIFKGTIETLSMLEHIYLK